MSLSFLFLSSLLFVVVVVSTIVVGVDVRIVVVLRRCKLLTPEMRPKMNVVTSDLNSGALLFFDGTK